MSSTRRDFIKSAFGTAAAVSLAPGIPIFLARTAAAAAAANDRRDTVLVVLQLSGGNDGLNTIVPFDDDAYGRHRQTLRLTKQDVLPIDAQLGFHKELGAVARLYQEQKLSVVQGVGYPKNNRDHEGALRDWHTAQPGEAACQTGWLGRAIDAAASADRPHLTGIFVGQIPAPFALNAARSVVPAIHGIEQTKLRPFGSSGRVSARRPAPESRPPVGSGASDPLLEFVRQGTAAAYANSQRVEDVLRGARGAAGYPAFPLGVELQAIAELIRADLGIRIFFAELGGGGIGGFDNHANQRDNHAALLRQLSEAVAAFIHDLQRAQLLERVVLMTFSEFGRTLAENGRRGTDHGDAQPVFLAGGGLRGGLLGKHPSLTDLDGDSPKSHTDFRRVYATVLDRWLGFDSRDVLGGRFEPLDVFA